MNGSLVLVLSGPWRCAERFAERNVWVERQAPMGHAWPRMNEGQAWHAGDVSSNDGLGIAWPRIGRLAVVVVNLALRTDQFSQPWYVGTACKHTNLV